MAVRLTGSTGISLKFLLNAAATVCAMLSFFMGQEAVGPLYTLGFLVLLSVAVVIEWMGLPHPPRLLVNLATVAALLTIFARVRRNYIVEAFVEAVLLMTAVKMLEKKESRDYVQIAALSLAMVVSYAMLSVEKTFIVYCFGLALLCTLILILAAWLAGDPDARLSGREVGQVALRTFGLFGMMLPLSLLLFFVSPRTASPLFGARRQYGIATTGFSDQVQLGDATSIQSSKRLAFRAVMEPLNEARTPYWRGSVLGIFEGRFWLASSGRGDRGDFIPDADAPRIAQQIFLEPGNRGYLFALDQPLSVSGVDAAYRGDGVYRDRSRAVGRRLQYEAVSVLSPRMKPVDPDFPGTRYLTFPADFIPRLQAVVAELTRGMNDRQKAEAIMGYLAPPAFGYSLEGLPPDPQNALEHFLFTGRKGNCEYFASAMGVMLRMAGVPARLVTGYRGGVYNSAGGYYIVQEELAHVWVEAWDGEAAAWVRCDPTPPGGALAGAAGFNTWELYLDMLDYQWSRLVVNYTWETQAELIQSFREAVSNPRASLTPTRDGMMRLGSALSVPSFVLSGVVACFAVFYLTRYLRRRRPEIVLLRAFERAMRRRGYVRHESEGLGEFLDRVDDPQLRSLAQPFVRRFEEFWYRDRPMDADTRKALRAAIDRIVKYDGIGHGSS